MVNVDVSRRVSAQAKSEVGCSPARVTHTIGPVGPEINE